MDHNWVDQPRTNHSKGVAGVFTSAWKWLTGSDHGGPNAQEWPRGSHTDISDRPRLPQAK